MITKEELDNLVIKYETPDFIETDPVQFVHKFKKKEDIEIAGFLASLFAYGNRQVFIKKLNELFNLTGNKLKQYIKSGDFSNLKGFEYRFAKDNDIIPIFERLNNLYKSYGGLEELFAYAYHEFPRRDTDIYALKYDHFLQTVVDYFYSYIPESAGHGFYHMIPNPRKGGAMKRMNMFLRWMVRKSPVDVGIWDFMKPSNLYIPLDVHVGRMSRAMGLLDRKANDFRAVMDLTLKLKEFCPEDPVKYDFAMFAFGVELKKNTGVLINE